MIIHSLTLSQFQVDLEEANGRIVDLVAINNNLTSIKNKLETELSTAQADLDEVRAAQLFSSLFEFHAFL